MANEHGLKSVESDDRLAAEYVSVPDSFAGEMKEMSPKQVLKMPRPQKPPSEILQFLQEISTSQPCPQATSRQNSPASSRDSSFINVDVDSVISGFSGCHTINTISASMIYSNSFELRKTSCEAMSFDKVCKLLQENQEAILSEHDLFEICQKVLVNTENFFKVLSSLPTFIELTPTDQNARKLNDYLLALFNHSKKLYNQALEEEAADNGSEGSRYNVRSPASSISSNSPDTDSFPVDYLAAYQEEKAQCPVKFIEGVEFKDSQQEVGDEDFHDIQMVNNEVEDDTDISVKEGIARDLDEHRDEIFAVTSIQQVEDEEAVPTLDEKPSDSNSINALEDHVATKFEASKFAEIYTSQMSLVSTSLAPTVSFGRFYRSHFPLNIVQLQQFRQLASISENEESEPKAVVSGSTPIDADSNSSPTIVEID